MKYIEIITAVLKYFYIVGSVNKSINCILEITLTFLFVNLKKMLFNSWITFYNVNYCSSICTKQDMIC